MPKIIAKVVSFILPSVCLEVDNRFNDGVFIRVGKKEWWLEKN